MYIFAVSVLAIEGKENHIKTEAVFHKHIPQLAYFSGDKLLDDQHPSKK